jgi:hypothetical protein
MDWIGFPQESFTIIRTDYPDGHCPVLLTEFLEPPHPGPQSTTDSIIDFVIVLSKDFDADLIAKPSPAPEFIRKKFISSKFPQHHTSISTINR